MPPHPVPHLAEKIHLFVEAKMSMLELWVSYDGSKTILQRHAIESGHFMRAYGAGVFDYFVSVIRGERQIGDCPVIADLLEYLKDHEISADELFLLCSHFRRALIDISYEIGVNNKALFDEISYVFDLNFAGVLKRYTETIYQKDREIARNVKLLEEYRRAIDESGIVSKTDAKGVITYVNEKFSRICGYAPGELVGRSHSLMRHPEMPDDFFETLWKTIGANRIFRGTIKNRKKRGESFYVDTTIVPITDMQNRITEYMAISYEVTDLVVAKEEAIAAGEAKEYFLSNMSHEIRTPLNAILGFVALLRDDAKSPKDRRYLDIISNSGENLLSIINDILDFSKLRSGEFTIEPRPFNLHHTITHTLELFVPSVNQHLLTLSSFIDPDIPYELISDPLRIQQVVSNLLSNAIKFTPPYGAITVEASFGKSAITVSVSDTGIGIAQQDLEHIFDPFSQARSDEERQPGGTGLGLSISAQLVRHMGGEISVISHPGVGSTFSFTLPVKVGDNGEAELIDLARIRSLRMALLDNSGRPGSMGESLQRYLESFGVELFRVCDVSEPYDLLFFTEQSLEPAGREAVMADPRPAVALMEAPDERYDAVLGVTPLVMPLYCSKLQEVLEEAFSSQAEAAGPSGTAGWRQFRGHVLVAEDNEANQELIQILLENAGLSSEVVSNGAEALERMKRGGFDLVLMDEQMPVMSGFEAARKMRRFEAQMRREHLPVIAITANVMGRHTAGTVYDGFIGKPIQMERLSQILEAYLGSGTEMSGAAEQDGGMDRSRLCELLQITPAQLEMLLEVYVRKMRESLEKLQAAVAQRDLPAVAQIAHSVKGSSSNFRFEKVTQLAARIETDARAGTPADYARLADALTEVFEAQVI